MVYKEKTRTLLIQFLIAFGKVGIISTKGMLKGKLLKFLMELFLCG